MTDTALILSHLQAHGRATWTELFVLLGDRRVDTHRAIKALLDSNQIVEYPQARTACEYSIKPKGKK